MTCTGVRVVDMHRGVPILSPQLLVETVHAGTKAAQMPWDLACVRLVLPFQHDRIFWTIYFAVSHRVVPVPLAHSR
jgi:hypothetical protein